jgi:hypothetical protein
MRHLNIPVDIIVLFWYWFQHLFSVVAWDGLLSCKFDLKSGVRQGGICSCWIFNMCIDGLIDKLQRSGYGCYFYEIFAGAILYADDIMLLSASLYKLQCMLDLCAEFALDNGLSFNCNKSVCLVIGKDCEIKSLPFMYLGNESVVWTNECCYLGVVLYSGREFSTGVDTRRGKFCAAANDILTL